MSTWYKISLLFFIVIQVTFKLSTACGIRNESVVIQWSNSIAITQWNTLKVIPLKLLYYQTFFETWHNQHSWYEHLKNAIKRWGHGARLRVSRLLNWGIFTGCAFKIRIPFLQNCLCYLKHTKCYLEHKASFIQISSSFYSFLIAWLWGYYTFSDSYVFSLISSPWPKYTK